MPQSLYRSLLDAPEGGGDLPMPFADLEIKGAKFRRGQVAIVGAAPGGGKTAFITNYCITAVVAQSVSILYYSPDSDIMTIGPRILGTMQAREVRNVFRDFRKGGTGFDQHLEKAKELGHIQWCFDPAPRPEDVKGELDAFVAVHGHYPDLIILDNIKDFDPGVGGEGGDHTRHGATVDYFHQMARLTNAAVVLLHHLKGQYENSNEPPPLSALLGNISKPARL